MTYLRKIIEFRNITERGYLKWLILCINVSIIFLFWFTIIFASLYPPPTIIPPRFFCLRTLFSDPPPTFSPHYPYPQIFFVFIPFSVTPLHFCHITPPLPTFSPNKPSGFFVFVPFLVTPNYIYASFPRPPPPPRFFCLHYIVHYPFRWPPYIFATLPPPSSLPPVGDAGDLSREYVLRIPSVS